MIKKRAACSICSVVLGVVLVASMAGLVGCDDAVVQLLLVTPSEVTLQYGTNTASFEVQRYTDDFHMLDLPMEWRVSNEALGSITAVGPTNAMYRRTEENGVNTITVTDQYGNEGFTTVNQEPAQYVLEVTVDPDPIPYGSNLCLVTVTGGFGPYSWSVLYSTQGFLVDEDATGDNVVYQSLRTGMNAVNVVDANGVTGNAIISQLDEPEEEEEEEEDEEEPAPDPGG